jgi:hypothetical protein
MAEQGEFDAVEVNVVSTSTVEEDWGPVKGFPGDSRSVER